MTKMGGIRPPGGAFMSPSGASVEMQQSSFASECLFLKNPITGELLLTGLAKVSILELGGTIASINSPDGKAPQLSMEALFKRIGGAWEGVSVASPGSRKYWAGPPQESSALTFPDIMRTVDRLYHHTQAAQSVVVTCGTDRLADVAKMASLMLRFPLRPIIFTGSQKTIDDPENDVERNLRDALFMADKLDPGFYVVFGGRVLNAFEAYKYSTSDLDAFRSSSSIGDLGTVDSAKQKYNIHDARYQLTAELRSWLKNAAKIDAASITFCDYDHNLNVCAIEIPMGNDTRYAELLLADESLEGLVLRIPGTGGIDKEAAKRLSEAARYKDKNGNVCYKPVVIVTRCPNGETDLNVYAGSSGVEEQRAIIPAGDLSAETASLLLQWGLGGTSDIQNIRKLFEAPFNPVSFANVDRRTILDRRGNFRQPWNINPFEEKMRQYEYASEDDPSFRTYD